MAKRGATIQLTDRNWDKEEESEEVLNFLLPLLLKLLDSILVLSLVATGMYFVRYRRYGGIRLVSRSLNELDFIQ